MAPDQAFACGDADPQHQHAEEEGGEEEGEDFYADNPVGVALGVRALRLTDNEKCHEQAAQLAEDLYKAGEEGNGARGHSVDEREANQQ